MHFIDKHRGEKNFPLYFLSKKCPSLNEKRQHETKNRLDKIPENSDKTNKDGIRQGFSELIKNSQIVYAYFCCGKA